MQNEDLPVCAQLAQTAYRAEKAVHPALPDVPDDSFLPLLADILPEKHAYLAKEDGRIVGYLCFTGAFEGAFGNCRGVFSPLHASAFYGSQPGRTLSALLSHAMESLYAQGVTSFALSCYAHDERTLHALALNGFGIRCCDLMARTKLCATPPDSIELRPMRTEDIPQVLKLYRGLEAHMNRIPVCMPQERLTEQDLAAQDILIACANDMPIACLALEKGGETYLDNQSGTMHIGRTYCHPDFRGTGATAALVAYASDQLHQQDVKFLGVTCETLNPPAYRFWQKHFIPFTYSAVRRLDERLLP